MRINAFESKVTSLESGMAFILAEVRCLSHKLGVNLE